MEPPLDLRRLKLTLPYINIVKLKANIDIDVLALDCVFNPQFEHSYDNNKTCIKSIGFGIQKNIDNFNNYTFRYCKTSKPF